MLSTVYAFTLYGTIPKGLHGRRQRWIPSIAETDREGETDRQTDRQRRREEREKKEREKERERKERERETHTHTHTDSEGTKDIVKVIC